MSTAAPMDGLSLSDEASLSQLRQRLQRDVNCLSDPDRSTRKRALTKLRKAIFQEAKIPEVVLRGFLTRHLAERLVGMLADPVEKCREMAGGLLLEFVGAVDDVRPDAAALAKQLFPMAGARIGSVPLVEPAEEVRALVLRLCGALLRGKSAESFGSEVAEEACGILSAALTDPFPEVKRECCSLLLRLAAVCPGELRSRMGKVLRPLIVNLGHQHSKTRQMTLQALGALLLCGSDDLDKPLRELILPQFGNLLYDRTVAVRRELAGVLAALVEAGFPDTPPSSSNTDNHNPDGNPASSLVTAMDVGEDDHTSSGDNCGASEPDGRACPLASAVPPSPLIPRDGETSAREAVTRGGAGAGPVRLAKSKVQRRNKYLEPFRAELVSLLMKLLADESEAVCEQAGRLLEELGEVWARSSDEAAATATATAAAATGYPQHQTSPPVPPLPPPPVPPLPPPSPSAATPPAPAASSAPLRAAPPAPAARALCASLLPLTMPAAIEEASHWTVRGRRRALRLLCFLVQFAGEEVTPYVPQLLGTLGEASRDDELEVRQAVDKCAAAVGEAPIDLAAVLDVLLPILRGEVSGESGDKHLTQALAVLAPVVSAAAAARPRCLAPHLAAVCAALCGKGLLGADPSSSSAEGGGEELWEAGLEACRAVVGTGLGEELRRPQARLDVLRTLLWLLAGSSSLGDGGGTGAGGVGGGDGSANARDEVLQIASQLASHQEDRGGGGGGGDACEGAQDLFARHFTDLLAYVVGEGAGAADAGGAGGSDGGGVVNGGSEGVSGGGWDRGSRRRTGFEALLRSAPGAVGEHLGEVMPIFRGLLHDPKRDPELRLSMLALLECVVKQDKVTEESMRPHAQLVLREMVLPNAVWRAGLVAATVRKVAIAVLYTSLRGNKIGVEAVYATAEQLLPVLKTNLEDHESTTRQMTCLSLEMMFRLMPGALGEEPVRLIYPELLKRLDDSNDAVRLSVCGTIAAFFRATAPQNIRGSVLKYSSEQLLVHLDDNDESMQRAVFSVMEVAIAIDPESVKKLASDARASHRAPDYCDRLIALCGAI